MSPTGYDNGFSQEKTIISGGMNVKIESNKERLKWCRKLYGDVISVGRVFKSGKPVKRRRYFIIRFRNGDVYAKAYARYLKEKEVGHKLPSHIHAHHKDRNTLNDSLKNLLRKRKRNHSRIHIFDGMLSEDNILKMKEFKIFQNNVRKINGLDKYYNSGHLRNAKILRKERFNKTIIRNRHKRMQRYWKDRMRSAPICYF